MKAVYMREHGGIEVLEYGELPEPAVGPNDVKVRVKACGVNRVDVFTRAGVRGTRLPLTEPHTLGGDVAGEVAEVGSKVTRVKLDLGPLHKNAPTTCHPEPSRRDKLREARPELVEGGLEGWSSL